MKYSKLIISGLPKTFNVTHAGDYVQDLPDDSCPEDILYDFYFADADEDKGEEGLMLFKYNESATGIYLVHNPHLQTLAVELSPWASEADVLLYGAFINAVLAKHKRARLYDKYAPLKGLTDDDVQQTDLLMSRIAAEIISGDVRFMIADDKPVGEFLHLTIDTTFGPLDIAVSQNQYETKELPRLCEGGYIAVVNGIISAKLIKREKESTND